MFMSKFLSSLDPGMRIDLCKGASHLTLDSQPWSAGPGRGSIYKSRAEFSKAISTIDSQRNGQLG